MEKWVEDEIEGSYFRDRRLHRRLGMIVSDLAQHPEMSVTERSRSAAEVKATYRFWDNDQVSAQAILAGHQQATLKRIQAAGLKTILVVQDTTIVNVSQREPLEGMGRIGLTSGQGLWVHSSMSVSPEGVPLGLLGQQTWARAKTKTAVRHERRKKPIEDKESYRWLQAEKACLAGVPADLKVVTITDREGDIYDFFAQPRRPGAEFLVRGTHNRRVQHPERYVWEAVRRSPEQGRQQIVLPRTDTRSERKVELSVRWVRLELLPPNQSSPRKYQVQIPVTVLLAEEQKPPAGQKPVSWLLYTTLPIVDLASAEELIRWYRLRWLIERFHYALKSGCRIEKLQLETAERFERALATYTLVAWRLLWLTYQARETPDTSAAIALTPLQLRVLVASHYQRHPRERPPDGLLGAPTLKQAVRWTAMLGGFLGRKSDGEPGLTTLWRGLRRLDDLVAGALLVLGGDPDAPQDGST
jgi:hypothetical protein